MNEQNLIFNKYKWGRSCYVCDKEVLNRSCLVSVPSSNDLEG